ncbi:MAG: hypothetical protein KY475_19155 [Planctomycetes bacterium]|nr:hypothetical protein [Planctomycetota bacterium]
MSACQVRPPRMPIALAAVIFSALVGPSATFGQANKSAETKQAGAVERKSEEPKDAARRASDEAREADTGATGGSLGDEAREADEATVPSLDQMLAVALDHHPEIRAAEARLAAVRAELDRTRLDVVRQITAFRERWRADVTRLHTAQQELLLVEHMYRAREGGRERVLDANKKVALLKAKLSEFEAELPFLLGRMPNELPRAVDSSKQQASRADLVAQAGQVVQLTLAAYRDGRGDAERVYAWSRRLLDAELALGEEQSDEAHAVEAHHARMKTLVELAKTMFQTGQVGQEDVLAANYYLGEAELLLPGAKEE